MAGVFLGVHEVKAVAASETINAVITARRRLVGGIRPSGAGRKESPHFVMLRVLPSGLL
ncbi:MAG: hypothetical protein ACJ72W_28575 [Actinoallomurus sp.]